jgi:hypothetical protein
MRQEAEAFGTANRLDLFKMLDTYFRDRCTCEFRRMDAEWIFHALA